MSTTRAVSRATPEPRPLSPAEIENLKALAVKTEQALLKARAELRKWWVNLAEVLYVLHEKRLWQVLDYDSEAAYLAGPDIEIGEDHAKKLRRLYGEFVVKRGVPKEELYGTSLEKLQIALPAVKGGKAGPMDAISDAKVLTRPDMQTHYAEGRDAPLAAEREPPLCKCSCGHIHKMKAKP